MRTCPYYSSVASAMGGLGGHLPGGSRMDPCPQERVGGVCCIVWGGWCCPAERGTKAHGSKYPPRSCPPPESSYLVESVVSSGEASTKKPAPYVCGLVGPRTQVSFRSLTAEVFLLIEISRELFDFSIAGEELYEQVLKFVRDMLERQRTRNCNHDVTLVMFGRSPSVIGADHGGHVHGGMGGGVGDEPAGAGPLRYRKRFFQVCCVDAVFVATMFIPYGSISSTGLVVSTFFGVPRFDHCITRSLYHMT